MRVLHAFNLHRGGGGANNATRATIELSQRMGIQVEVFARSSVDVPAGIGGRIRTALAALCGGESLRTFLQTVDRFKPDLVHIHELFPLISPWLLPQCTRQGIPVVMSCVDYRLTCPVVTHFRNGNVCSRCRGGHEYWAVLGNCRGNLAESATMALFSAVARTFRLYSGHVRHFIAPSPFTRDWLVENAAIPEDRITAIAPIVEIPQTAADPGVGGYIAFAGRFAPSKGISTLAEAARRCGLPIRAARNVASLVTVDVPEEIEVVVTRGRSDLDAFYRGARMIVVPSLWFETFGLVAAEAMSHGVPAVVSRIGAVEGLVRDGEDGLLFEPGDAVDLARKMERLWTAPDLCRQLGAAARAKARRLWCPERHHHALLGVYARATAPEAQTKEPSPGKRDAARLSA
jgi:glycosyltransferase involved in cell wall biosynthesis